MPPPLSNTRRIPAPRTAIAIVRRCGSRAPTLTLPETPAQPSAFISTIRQLPVFGDQVTVRAPVPTALARQKPWADGGELGAPPE